MKKRMSILLIIGLIIVVGLASEFIAISIIEDSISRNLIKEEANGGKVIAEKSALAIEAKIDSMKQNLKLMSQIPEIRYGNRETCNRKMYELATDTDLEFGNMLRVDEKGIVQCSLVKETIGSDLTNFSPTIREILKKKERKMVMGHPIKSPLTDKYSQAMYLPLFSENDTFEGMLGGIIYLDEIDERYFKTEVLREGYGFVLEDNGEIIYHPDKNIRGKNIWSNEMQYALGNNTALNGVIKGVLSGTISEPGVTNYSFLGEQKEAAYAIVNIFPERRWAVVIVAPTNDIMRQIKNPEPFEKIGIEPFSSIRIILALVAIISAAFAYWYVVAKVLAPIEEITSAVDEMSKGKLYSSINPRIKHSNDEIGMLGKSYDRVLASLKVAVNKINVYSEKMRRLRMRRKKI